MRWATIKKNGFTIVELLIVVVVIAILAAITIVAYNGIQGRAKASAAQSAAAQAAKKVAVWQVDNPGQSPDQDTFNTLVGSFGGASYQYSAKANGAFCLTATTNNVSYFTGGSSPVAGACDGHGVNGVPPIVNVVVNPSSESTSSGWGTSIASSGAATTTRESSGGYSGTYFSRATYTTSPTAPSGERYLTGTQVTVGQAYSGAVYVRTNRAQVAYLRLRFQGTGGGDVFGQSTAIPANTWTRIGIANATALTGTVQISVILISGSVIAQVGDTFDADAAILYIGSTIPNFADGNSEGWVWDSTINASSSRGPAK
jgi:prepilin-type N-terminal cleavage/methylation domain-containing protein